MDWTEVQAGSDPLDANSTPNQAPQFRQMATNCAGQTFVFEFNVTDPDDDNLTYSILYGDDAEFFE